MFVDDKMSNVPSYLLKEIHKIEAPHDEFFIIKAPPQLHAILRLRKRSVKLKALEDFYLKAVSLYDEYEKDCFVFIHELNNYVKINKPANEARLASYSEVYAFLEAKKEVYRHSLISIKEALDDIRAEIEIEKTYCRTDSNLNSVPTLPNAIKDEFSKLFINPDIENAFIKKLKINDYITDDEKWKGVSSRPGELREAYDALKYYDLLSPGKRRLNSLRIFYRRFGLKVQGPGEENPYISDRALRSVLNGRDCDLFKEILAPLTHFIKK